MTFQSIRLLTLIAGVMMVRAETPDKFNERFPRYRLQPSDVVEVQYRYTPEYNATVTVQPDGYISLQTTGDLHVAGETLQEAARTVEKGASARLKDPEVTVLIKDFIKPHYIVAGEVNRPGTYDLRGDITAVQAVASGGGFKDSAKHSHVILIRRVNNEWAETRVLDMKSMMQTGRVTEDVLLKPDDILLVPQNNASKMERYIRWAGIAMYGASLAHP
jgi:polysaccharide export outer membrane protein